MGQNALPQAKHFKEAIDLMGIYQYDKAAIAPILEQTGGRPSEVQSLCQAVIEHVKHHIQG
jgi:hypothetical protein